MKKLMLWLWVIVVLMACTKQEPSVAPSKAKYSQGVFTINEGIFGSTSGTITHFGRDGAVTNRIFWKKNQRDLGDVVQSLAFQGERAYIVVNNSNKIEVVEAGTFAEVAQITDLRLPRYCLPISSTEAYVSEWGADGLTGSLARIDLTNNTLIERFPVGVGPERLLLKDGRLYVSHVGGFGTNNIVTVFDIQQRSVLTTLTVGDRPSGLVEDYQGQLWVACSGNVRYLTYPNIDTTNSTESQLIAINPSTNTIVQQIKFGKGNPIGQLTLNTSDKKQLYYTKQGQVWHYNLLTNTERPLFSGSFYGLGYDEHTQYIYAATSSGVNPASIQRYNLEGILVDAYTAGTFANGFIFR